MADWLNIKGVKPYDGRYLFDVDGAPFTTREWGYIKRLSGYMPLTVSEGFAGGDPELYAAFAVIALVRAGRVEPADVAGVFDRIADAPFGAAVQLENDGLDDTAADAVDPPQEPPASGNTSGTDLPTKSGTLDTTRDDSGPPRLDSSRSGPTRLAS